ncbi:MAG: hypothetical protein ACK5FS_15990 [Planctomycetota bacterium]
MPNESDRVAGIVPGVICVIAVAISNANTRKPSDRQERRTKVRL